MEILRLHELNAVQIKDIEDLVCRCHTKDGLKRTLYLDNDINFYENLYSFYLLYDKGSLLSVLTIFQPFMEEAEISAYTLPEERQKGFFTRLLDLAEEELVGFDIYKMLFVVEPESISGNAVAMSCDGVLVKSDYLLAFEMEKRKSSINQLVDMTLVEVHKEKLLDCAHLNHKIFGNNIDEAMEIIKTAMDSEHMKCYGAYVKNELIGICNVNYGSESASLFGLGVIKEYRGKGYGKTLLSLVINQVAYNGRRRINLEVSSQDEIAFSLYIKTGFKILTRYDYYEVIIELE